LKRKIFAPVEVVDILTYHPLNQSFEECLNVAQQARPELKISFTQGGAGGEISSGSASVYLPTLSFSPAITQGLAISIC